MSAIWKLIKFIFFLVILVLILGLIFRNPLVKTGIEKGSEFAKVPTTVGKVDISIDKPTIELSHISVSSPEGLNYSENESLAEINRVFLHYNFLGLFKKTLHAHDVEVDVSSLALQLNAKGLNLYNLGDDFLRAVRKLGGKETEEDKEKDAEEIQLKVDRLMFKLDDIKFSSDIPVVPAFTLSLNYSNVFENLEGTSADIALQVLNQVAKGTPLEPVLKAGQLDFSSLQDLTKQLQDTFSGVSGAAGKAVSDAADSATDALGKATDKASEALDKASDKIKGLFK